MGLSRSSTPLLDIESALYRAAERATLAPSFLNTQPWRWRIREGRLDLFADLDRVVTSVDRDRRLLTISCGAGLHHACAALRAEGLTPHVERRPDARREDHLASISVGDGHAASKAELDLAQAMQDRRSERRGFSAGPRVESSDVELLQRLATQYGVWLHEVSDDQRPFLVSAVGNAALIEDRQEEYQQDLLTWTGLRRPGEGVEAAELADRAQPIAPHDYADRPGGIEAALGNDADAGYLILATQEDTVTEWLRAGEALSVVWLTATTRGLAGSVLTNLSEVPGARALVASLLTKPGQPQLVLRIGIPTWPAPPATPRRQPETVITIERP